MFLSPFTVSLGCDAAVIVVYLQRAENFGGTPWFSIVSGRDYTTEMVDVVRDFCCCVRSACPCSCTDLSATGMWHHLGIYLQSTLYDVIYTRYLVIISCLL